MPGKAIASDLIGGAPSVSIIGLVRVAIVPKTMGIIDLVLEAALLEADLPTGSQCDVDSCLIRQTERAHNSWN